MRAINIAADFSKLPGPRYTEEGEHSGQEFREKLLEPAFLQTEAENNQLEIQLDGVEFGYPTSFLEEAFGGLARLHGIERVQKRLVFVSNDEPLLIRQIERYIRTANETVPPKQRS
jgi:hypothetical protein